ncbi:Zn-dependent exopeptidase, partial [Lentinus brumalis]
LDGQLQSLGVTTKLADLGKHVTAILGRVGDDPKKKTVLIYGHYDVQPAQKSDGWDTEPFTLVVDEKTGKLIGRGSTDARGPILGWLNMLEAHKTLGFELPVNLRFCFEGMEENGSERLDALIKTEVTKGKESWFDGVDCVCISDNYWLNSRTPCLTYGLRGLVYFKLTISGPARDLHSGVFGCMVHEPMTDLINIMGKLVTPDGTILVPGVEDMVPSAQHDEIAIYEKLDYSVSDQEYPVPWNADCPTGQGRARSTLSPRAHRSITRGNAAACERRTRHHSARILTHYLNRHRCGTLGPSIVCLDTVERRLCAMTQARSNCIVSCSPPSAPPSRILDVSIQRHRCHSRSPSNQGHKHGDSMQVGGESGALHMHRLRLSLRHAATRPPAPSIIPSAVIAAPPQDPHSIPWTLETQDDAEAGHAQYHSAVCGSLRVKPATGQPASFLVPSTAIPRPRKHPQMIA